MDIDVTSPSIDATITEASVAPKFAQSSKKNIDGNNLNLSLKILLIKKL
jgi:hypothetical protein